MGDLAGTSEGPLGTQRRVGALNVLSTDRNLVSIGDLDTAWQSRPGSHRQVEPMCESPLLGSQPPVVLRSISGTQVWKKRRPIDRVMTDNRDGYPLPADPYEGPQGRILEGLRPIEYTSFTKEKARILDQQWTAGEAAHGDEIPPLPCLVDMTYYNADKVVSQAAVQNLNDLAKFPRWAASKWIDIRGHDRETLNKVQSMFNLNPVAMEEVYHVPQKPKVEVFHTDNSKSNGPDTTQVFLIVHVLSVRKNRQIDARQISIFFFGRTVITIHDKKEFIWEEISRRINRNGSRIRANGANYLLFSFLDMIGHYCFHLLEHYGDHLEILEEDVLSQNRKSKGKVLQRRIHTVKREILMVRRLMWSLRELLQVLSHLDLPLMNESSKVFLRDVYDHVIQALDIIETYRELSTSISELYLSSISHQMNEVMTMLTLISSIFIPLTFLCGVYGMNFEYMPELDLKFGYLAFWGVALAIVFGMLNYYKFKGWM